MEGFLKVKWVADLVSCFFFLLSVEETSFTVAQLTAPLL